MSRSDKLSTYRTMIADDMSATSVQYVQTRIVFYDKGNGTITLRSGGWETVTTKRKLNQAAKQFGLDYGVHQVKGVWSVDRKNPAYVFDNDDNEPYWLNLNIPFVDGMTFPRDVATHVGMLKSNDVGAHAGTLKLREARKLLKPRKLGRAMKHYAPGGLLNPR